MPKTDDDTTALGPSDAPHQVPATVSSLEAHDDDDEFAAVRDAIASGVVPVFDHDPRTDPETVPNPYDAEAEAAAFRELVDAIREAAEPGTEITLMDPDAFAKGLT